MLLGVPAPRKDGRLLAGTGAWQQLLRGYRTLQVARSAEREAKRKRRQDLTEARQAAVEERAAMRRKVRWRFSM